MTSDRHSESPTPQQMAGGVAVVIAVSIFALAMMEDLPFNLPRTWYVHRALWILLACLLLLAAWWLQRGTPPLRRDHWRPTRRGVRFERLVVYSKPDCHLCDDAKDLLGHYSEYLPEIVEVDINDDPELQQRYGESIPVVEIDGKLRFRGRVNELLLRRLIEGAGGVKDEG